MFLYARLILEIVPPLNIPTEVFFSNVASKVPILPLLYITPLSATLFENVVLVILVIIPELNIAAP